MVLKTQGFISGWFERLLPRYLLCKPPFRKARSSHLCVELKLLWLLAVQQTGPGHERNLRGAVTYMVQEISSLFEYIWKKKLYCLKNMPWNFKVSVFSRLRCKLLLLLLWMGMFVSWSPSPPGMVIFKEDRQDEYMCLI